MGIRSMHDSLYAMWIGGKAMTHEPEAARPCIGPFQVLQWWYDQAGSGHRKPAQQQGKALVMRWKNIMPSLHMSASRSYKTKAQERSQIMMGVHAGLALVLRRPCPHVVASKLFGKGGAADYFARASAARLQKIESATTSLASTHLRPALTFPAGACAKYSAIVCHKGKENYRFSMTVLHHRHAPHQESVQSVLHSVSSYDAHATCSLLTQQQGGVITPCRS